MSEMSAASIVIVLLLGYILFELALWYIDCRSYKRRSRQSAEELERMRPESERIAAIERADTDEWHRIQRLRATKRPFAGYSVRGHR